ncbi:P-loop containing nucleoside triphosphate hydrolase protein [Lenzites betulinus]|nr:P-loop containing nucleoside triphosphate hydrolase protein [Lenzites betulinus]
MRSYFSRSRSSRVSNPNPFSEKHSETRPLTNADNNSEDGQFAMDVSGALPPPNLKIKRVDHFWSNWSKGWKYRNTGSSVVAEAVRPVGNGTANDPWQNFCFVVVRKFPQQMKNDFDDEEIVYKIVVKSPYLLKACKDVIGDVPGVSWTAEPLELDPQLLLAFFPQFEAYEKQLRMVACGPPAEYVLATLSVLLDYLRKDYRATLAKIANLTAHGEITAELLYAVLVPRTTIVTECPVTGETRALQLRGLRQVRMGLTRHAPAVWRLLCESVDSLEEAIHGRNVESNSRNALAGRAAQPRAHGVGEKAFGRVETVIYIEPFAGTKKINTLAAYPLKYSHDPEGLAKTLLERGRKWASLKGIHHVHYQGTAAFRLGTHSAQTIIKYNVDSRIMIDRRNFLRLNPNYARPKTSDAEQNNGAHDASMLNPRMHPRAHLDRGDEDLFEENVFTLDVRTPAREEATLKDEDLLIASPILYGYSLSDKIWLEFNVQHIQPIVWNEESFANLVLADDRKDLLRSLVDAHSVDLGFDDFVQGKGQGLIINLFGPPGVGKTLSAEATSERVHRPLYVVGGGDLGTKAADVDAELTRVFDIATSWKAIVLIDEADVFLERRSLHDLERNAMVAVFLRHVEYYRGILFLTTNRITAFDPAFLSRIHVALHFGPLSPAARAQVWRAFLRKAGVALAAAGEAALVARLAARDVNGRQIKNACRTAQSLAHSRGQVLGVEHLEETLDAMEDFNVEFAALGAKNIEV